MCDFDFVVSHGGRDDVERHMFLVGIRQKRKPLLSATMTNFFIRAAPSMSVDMAVIHAETLFAHLLVEHNIPLNSKMAGCVG